MRVGEWVLLPSLNLLRHVEDGSEVRLEPRHADLLGYFAAHPGEVLSADDIIANVWERQVVTDQSVYQAIARLRRAVNDNASQPRYIETVPKRGYRLIAAVSTVTDAARHAVGVADDVTVAAAPVAASAQPVSATRHAAGSSARLVAGAVVGVLLLGLLAWWIGHRQGAAGDIQPLTVAVLPFKALSEAPGDGFIAEGFAIELAHAIGRIDGVQVIGPLSSQLSLRLDNESARAGRSVDADVVVTGSIQRDGGGLRISGALTEVSSGYQLWSEAFDRSDQDMLRTRQDVARAVAAALRRNLAAGQAGPAPVEAGDRMLQDNFLLGRYYRAQRTQGDLERAGAYFDRALAIDPDYLPAMRGRAGVELLLSFYGSTPLGDALRNAEPYLRRGLEIAPGDAEFLALVGLSHYLQGNYGLAEDFLSRAVATHPNLSEGWMWLGLTLRQQGRLGDALPAFRHASSLEPLLVTAVANYANALSSAGQSDDALTLLEGLAVKANESFDNREQLFRALSAVARDSGRLQAAYRWARRALDVGADSPLAAANMAVVLGLLDQPEAAREFAARAADGATPGLGTRGYLQRAELAVPDIVERAQFDAQVSALGARADTPEIEWRQANLVAGMKAFLSGEQQRALELLDKALSDKAYPVIRADDDIYVCGALVFAMRSIGLVDAAADRLQACRGDLQQAQRLGWDSLSLKVGATRLAVLEGDTEQAATLLGGLYDAGFRNLSLLRHDPLLSTLAGSEAYVAVERWIVADVEASWRAISDEGGRQ